MIFFKFVILREPSVQVDLLYVVLLVLRSIIAFVIKALSGLSSTADAHDFSLKLNATLFLHDCCSRVRSYTNWLTLRLFLFINEADDHLIFV